jgi:hypothetical protein
MSHIAQITPARFRARTFYVATAAYRHLQDGPIELRLGPMGNTTFLGTLRPCNHSKQGFITCPDLYTRTSPALPHLPLQLADQLEYDVAGNGIRILAIQRTTTTLPVINKPIVPPQAAGNHLVLGAATPPNVSGKLPTYLKQSALRIQQLREQTLPARSSAYHGFSHPVMRRLYKQFPGLNIQRSDVTALYQQWSDPELALIASMIWGGINATRPKKNNGPSDLAALLSHLPSDLVRRMNHIRKLVLAGRLAQAFIDCSAGGAAKLKGVGSAYFTKVLFFLGEATDGMKPTPLVFDKWTQNAFFLLLSQSEGIQAAARWFKLPSRSKFAETKAILLLSGVSIQASAYLEYVNHMTSWAHNLDVPPGQLEQFVFGEDRRANPSQQNPRTEILNLIAPLLPLP